MRPVFSSVDAERDRQDAKWGQQNHHPFGWLAILMEEVGEAAKAALEGKASDYRKELIEAAAVACAAVECLERNGAELIDLTALQQEVNRLRSQVRQKGGGE